MITGEPERRTHDDSFKARVVAQSFAANICIADLAREHDLHPQLLYTWRALAKRGQLALPAEHEPLFAAVLAEPAAASTPMATPNTGGGEIVVEIGEVRLRIGPDVAPERVAALATALKSSR